MAFPNLTDLVTTGIENRSRKVADNVLKNTALYMRLKNKGKIRLITGGTSIMEELAFQENGNFGWYSGYDALPIAAQDVLTSATFSLKQAACPVVISGLEQLQNSGREAILDLMEQRLRVAESTMINNMGAAVYSDGTGYGGKQLIGLASAVPADPTTGTYGAIDRSIWSFWRSQVVQAAGYTAADISTYMNTLWASLVRGKDHPDLIIGDNLFWLNYTASLQAQQRFTQAEVGDLGFPTIKYMSADVVLDGGIGGFAPANSAWFLNTNYIFFRPHKDRNMRSLTPNRRVSVNQDAEVAIMAFAGNMTSNGARYQGFFKGY